jgi:hypothetical protein
MNGVSATPEPPACVAPGIPCPQSVVVENRAGPKGVCRRDARVYEQGLQEFEWYRGSLSVIARLVRRI